jgi:hypothetical protein
MNKFKPLWTISVSNTAVLVPTDRWRRDLLVIMWIPTNTCLTTPASSCCMCVGWRLIMSPTSSYIVFWPPLRALDLKEMAREKLHASLIIHACKCKPQRRRRRRRPTSSCNNTTTGLHCCNNPQGNTHVFTRYCVSPRCCCSY